jgi:predicted nucleotidyltransferase
MTPWMVTPEKVEAAVARIRDLVRPRKLIIFGSYVRGLAKPDSDLDILVVTRDEVEDPRRESARIRRALRGISMCMDVLVVSESRLRELSQVPGLIYREALDKGRVVYESAG